MLHRPSPNSEARPQGGVIDMLVLHYTGMRTAEAALARLCDPAAKVSAHYLIDEDGSITALVAESARAWHAGLSSWRGRGDVNSRSIGIELVNPGHEFGYRPFPAVQMESLAALAANILSRHPIPARNVVGHADVAPARKEDPGELFDWPWLAARGIGLWPAGPASPRSADAPTLLARYGYDVADPPKALLAFQRHFRRQRLDGEADHETLGLIEALLVLAGELP